MLGILMMVIGSGTIYAGQRLRHKSRKAWAWAALIAATGASIGTVWYVDSFRHGPGNYEDSLGPSQGLGSLAMAASAALALLALMWPSTVKLVWRAHDDAQHDTP